MKRFLTNILALLFVGAAASAHTISVGKVFHRQGVETEQSTSGKTATSAAVKISSEDLTRYAGNSLQTVRVALPSVKIYVDSVVVWVRSSLDGENLAQGKATRFNDSYATIAQGWNEVKLTSPVALTESTTDLYVGYTYYQRTKVCATQWVSEDNATGSYLKLDPTADWKEHKGYNLAIEAGIDGDNMPQNDVWLMATRGLISDDGTRRIEARLYNRGQRATTSLHFNMSGTKYNGATTQFEEIEPDQLDTLVFDLKDAENLESNSKLTVELDQVNGTTDEYAADNKASCLFNFLRIVLVEEFTTEKCPNCPRAAGYLHDLLESSDVMLNIAAVCHHSGYNTDGFTTPTDLAYEWFYNAGGSTYAPALMYNRMNMGTTPVTGARSKDYVEACVKAIADQETALSLVAEATASADNKTVTVTVNGTRLKPFGKTDQRITVFLTEDNVLSTEGQAGAGTDTYYHQHIMRGINATWGDSIVWDGDNFEYTCSFNIDPTWKPADLKVIASVGDYDSSDPTNCQIENNAVATPEGWTDGIATESVTTETATPVAYFTLDGRQVSRPASGITIVKYSNGTVKKVNNI